MTSRTPVTSAPVALEGYCGAGVITPADVAAVRMLVGMARQVDPSTEPSLLAWVGMCLALRTPRDGHTCVLFSQIGAWAGDIDLSLPDHLPWPEEPRSWVEPLLSIPCLVGKPGERKPFILEGGDSDDGRHARLYVGRALAEEQAIAKALLRDGSQHVSVLLGGPGSGKTYTLAKDLIDLFDQSDTPPRIALAAPTGKAAARMTKAIEDRCIKAKASAAVIAAVRAAPATTIHRLLGYHPARTPQFAYGPTNPLDYDVVVLDEVSMVSSSLMCQVLSALGPHTKIRLVGDPDQLASVEAGSILSDIAIACRRRGSPLHARLTELHGQHRYAADSAIARLALAIRNGDADAALTVLASGSPDLTWIRPGHADGVRSVVALAQRHARELRECATRQGNDPAEHAKQVLAKQLEMQVLCARRSGPTGVSAWNHQIERGLQVGPVASWYSGRPIMITKNSPDLSLFNGDVGVIVPANTSGTQPTGDTHKDAVFILGDEIMRVPVTRLETVETVHAVTIHKSQGSEFGHVIIVLPDTKSRLLTRELLYTGVTRAMNRVTVIASEEVLREAMGRPIRRATGLATRL